jgi:non-ribosomal peptide synthetase component E (peptide arylation enzyme)
VGRRPVGGRDRARPAQGRLVLITTKSDPKRSDFLAFARARGASEMMVPSEVLILEKLPLLGSGKIDHLRQP